MFGYLSPNPGHDAAKVELECRPSEALRGNCHLENHEFRTGFEYPSGLGESGIQIHQVAHSPANHCSVERLIRKRKLEGVCVHRSESGRFRSAKVEHAPHEIRADDPSAETWASGQGGREIEGPRAEVEINSSGSSFPAQQRHGVAPPALIEPKADDAVEAIVGGGYGGKNRADIGPLFRTA
jgi:hypothetical protein